VAFRRDGEQAMKLRGLSYGAPSSVPDWLIGLALAFQDNRSDMGLRLFHAH
jgi:hypothetical protein